VGDPVLEAKGKTGHTTTAAALDGFVRALINATEGRNIRRAAG